MHLYNHEASLKQILRIFLQILGAAHSSHHHDIITVVMSSGNSGRRGWASVPDKKKVDDYIAILKGHDMVLSMKMPELVAESAKAVLPGHNREVVIDLMTLSKPDLQVQAMLLCIGWFNSHAKLRSKIKKHQDEVGCLTQQVESLMLEKQQEVSIFEFLDHEATINSTFDQTLAWEILHIVGFIS
jgi:hypothetical protein